MRGTRLVKRNLGVADGIIPAYAGNTNALMVNHLEEIEMIFPN